MKIICLIVIGLCISTSMLAAQKFATADGTYVFTAGDGWQSIGRGNSLLVLSRDNAATIVVLRGTGNKIKGATPEDVLKLYLDQFKTKGTPISNSTPMKKLVIGGMDAAQVEIDSALPDGKGDALKVHEILTILRESDTSVLISTASCRIETEDKYSAELEAVLDSISKGTNLAKSALAPFIPTPAMAMKFSLAKDNRKWVEGYANRSPVGFITELVPGGQSVDAWKELVTQEIFFVDASLPQYVGGWKLRLCKADPKIEMNEETKDDGSILVTYTSLADQEVGIFRFIKSSDGIYALGYTVRPQLKTEKEFKVWLDIINTAGLIYNPEKLLKASASEAEKREAMGFVDLVADHMGKDFFPPPTVTINDLFIVVQHYHQAHPELKGQITAKEAIEALAEKYPPPGKIL